MSTTATYPAPWSLKGQGHIVLFKADPEWLQANGFIPEELKARYIPSLGVAMFVRYDESTAGPYDELLFIPGRFQFDEGPRYSITKIYVSTMESVDNGQENWGIPKELADFDINSPTPRQKRFKVSQGDKLIADCQFQSGLVPLPVTTAVVPKALKTVSQYHGERLIHTSPSAKGWARMSRLTQAQFNNEYFPDLNQTRQLGVLDIHRFGMGFPIPDIRSR